MTAWAPGLVVAARADEQAAFSPPLPAQHSCLACGRHPATHAPGGVDACGACGLGDAITPPSGRIPTDDDYERSYPGALADAENIGRMRAEAEFQRGKPSLVMSDDGEKPTPRCWFLSAYGHLGAPAQEADGGIGYDRCEVRGNAAYEKRWNDLESA